MAILPKHHTTRYQDSRLLNPLTREEKQHLNMNSICMNKEGKEINEEGKEKKMNSEKGK